MVVIRKGPQGGKYYVKNGRKVYVHRSTRAGKKSSKRKSVKRRLKSGKPAGGSNVGRYKGVPKNLFCGPAGGAPAGSYPVNTRARAISAKSYARHAPNPAGIKRCANRIARKKGWMGKDGKIKRSTKRKSVKRKSSKKR
jgi:hypothetical protein